MADRLAAWWYGVVYWCCAFVGILGFRLRVAGRRHVPAHGPALLIANHQSFLDPPLVGVASPRPLCFLARKTLFRNRLFGWLIRSLQAVPVDQEGIAKEGLKAILEQLQRGRAVLVFPEGERCRDGRLHPLRPGILLLVKRLRLPIIPVGIAGAYDAWPRHRRLPWCSPLFLSPTAARLAVAIGPPVDSQSLAGLSKDEALARLHSALARVVEQAEQMRSR
jgi:1-acyl-sn-glycerol-3-phosphate acyltransferase